jgi:Rad3-related DNA helicase
VIRHAEDWGAIIFLDSRLRHRQESSHLSTWVQPLHEVWQDFGLGRASLESFFFDRDLSSMNWSQSSSDL